MKILHFSDLHLDIPFAASHMSPEVARGCRLRLRRTLQRILELAVAQDVDVVTIGGDLFEADRVSRDTIRFLMESLAQLSPLPVLIAPGNHDYYSPVSPYIQQKWPDNVHIFTAFQPQPFPLDEHVIIWGLAHTLPNERKNPIKGFSVPATDHINILLMHGSEIGDFIENRAAHAPFQLPDITEAGFDFALLGHYHNMHLLPDDKPVAVYPGSPQPLNFGEQDEHGITIISLGERGIDLEFINTANQYFITQNYTPQNVRDTHTLAQNILQAVPQKGGEANFLRLQLVGTLEEDLDLELDLLYEHLKQSFEHVIIKNELRAALNIEDLAQEPTVRGAFIRRLQQMLSEEKDDRELIRAALKFGLRAFDGENLTKV